MFHNTLRLPYLDSIPIGTGFLAGFGGEPALLRKPLIRGLVAKGTRGSEACPGAFRRRPVWDEPVSDADTVSRAQEVLGYDFTDLSLLATSLTHSSVASTRLESNERLELLGDAVLGMVVCEEVYRRFEDWLEGDLTRVKSTLVSRRICAEVADEIGLTDLLILGNGIDIRGRLPTSVRAAVFESVIGALFLDGGLEPARQFILRNLARRLEQYAAGQSDDNYKSELQQYTQHWLSATPHYVTLDEQGPDHSKCFEVCVMIDGERFPSAWGPNKKQAEQEAAQKALQWLRERKKCQD